MQNVDLHQLEVLLLEAARSAFTNIQQQHPDEHFYAFSLIHEPLWEGIYLASNTEEALLRCAERYHQYPDYLHMSVVELVTQLRWSSGDWEYIDATNTYFAEVNDWLIKHLLRKWIYESHNEEVEDKRDASVIEVCRNTLRQLDAEGIFGIGEAREKVTLNIMMGDQDRSWLEHGRLLNPPAVYERWLQELKAAHLY